MEPSKGNPRQYKVKAIMDAENAIESFLTGAHFEERLQERTGLMTPQGRHRVGSKMAAKARQRTLKVWCKLDALAAVVDGNGDMVRIGRVVKFIENKDELLELEERTKGHPEICSGPFVDLSTLEDIPWKESVLDTNKCAGSHPKEGQETPSCLPTRVPDGAVALQCLGTRPSVVLENGHLSVVMIIGSHQQVRSMVSGRRDDDGSVVRIKDPVFQTNGTRSPDSNNKPDPWLDFSAQVEESRLASFARPRSHASQGVPVDFLLKCIATPEQIEGCNVKGLDGKPLEKRREHKRRLVALIVGCHEAVNIHSDSSIAGGRGHMDKATRIERLEPQLFALSVAALRLRATEGAQAWQPAALQLQDDGSFKLMEYQTAEDFKPEQAQRPLAEVFASKSRDSEGREYKMMLDDGPLQLRKAVADLKTVNLSASWCDATWWRESPWRDDDWWDEDHAPRTKDQLWAWHNDGINRQMREEEPEPGDDEDLPPRAYPPAPLRKSEVGRRHGKKSGVLVELQYSTRNEDGDLDNDVVDIRDLRDAQGLFDGYTLSEMNNIIKPHYWCEAGAFATYVIPEKGTGAGVSRMPRYDGSNLKTGRVLRMKFKGSDLGQDGRADRKDDAATVDFGQEPLHGAREINPAIPVYQLKIASKPDKKKFLDAQGEMQERAEKLEMMEAETVKKEFYRVSMLERKKRGQRWKDHENPQLKGLAHDHPLREVKMDEDDTSFRRREKRQSKALSRLAAKTKVLQERVLEYARDEGPNSDAMERAVRNYLKNSPNALWACYQMADQLSEQAAFPLISDGDNAAVENPNLQDWSREGAAKMLRLAAKIAEQLDATTQKPLRDNPQLCAAWLQPKLNYDPLYVDEAEDPSSNTCWSKFKKIAGGQNVEPRGSTDAGPLYEAICNSDLDFVDVDWVESYVESISSGSFSMEDEYEMDLPTGLIDGLFGTESIESWRKQYYHAVVDTKVWPRPLFEGIFYCWCGLQVPGSIFRVPFARYLFDLAMYIVFLACFTYGVVLDRWDASEYTFVQLADADVALDGRTTVALMRFYSWLYLLGCLEKEVRQLWRLGSITYFGEFWNWVEVK